MYIMDSLQTLLANLRLAWKKLTRDKQSSLWSTIHWPALSIHCRHYSQILDYPEKKNARDKHYSLWRAIHWPRPYSQIYDWPEKNARDKHSSLVLSGRQRRRRRWRRRQRRRRRRKFYDVDTRLLLTLTTFWTRSVTIDSLLLGSMALWNLFHKWSNFWCATYLNNAYFNNKNML